MKLYFVYNKEDNKVACYSEEKQDIPDKFKTVLIDVKDEDLKKIQQNYQLNIIDEKLFFHPPVNFQKDILKQKLLDKTITIEDLAQFLLK